MKTIASLLLATLACLQPAPLQDGPKIVKVEDVAMYWLLEAPFFPVDPPVAGIFAGTPYAAVLVAHSTGKVSLIGLDGLIAVNPISPPLAFELHFMPGGHTQKTCYVDNQSLVRWCETCCSGLTDDECIKKHDRMVAKMQATWPKHPTNPTCP